MIKLKNYILDIDDTIVIFGLKGVLRNFHTKHGKEALSLIKNKIHKSTYYYWISGVSPIPIKYLKLFSKLDSNILDIAYKKMKFASVGNKKCLLPKIMTKDLAYLLGAINGDGYVHKNGRYITLATDSKYHIKIINLLFKKIFAIDGYITDNNTYHKIEIGSRPVHSFISLFCPVGKKTGHLRVPEEVKIKKELLLSYLSGLFDTDGCIGYNKKKRRVYFVFVQKDKNFTFDVYRCLVRLGFHVNEPRVWYSPREPYSAIRDLKEWRIYIGSKRDLYNFLNLIKFQHPVKKRKSEFIKNNMLKEWARADFRRMRYRTANLLHVKQMSYH